MGISIHEVVGEGQIFSNLLDIQSAKPIHLKLDARHETRIQKVDWNLGAKVFFSLLREVEESPYLTFQDHNIALT